MNRQQHRKRKKRAKRETAAAAMASPGVGRAWRVWGVAAVLTGFLVLGSCAWVGARGDEDAEATSAAAKGDPDRQEREDTVGKSEESGKDEDQEKHKAIPVEIAILGRGAIEARIRSSANLEAERHVEVYSKAGGLIRELYVEEGDEVREGQLLLRLEDDEQRNALAKVRAELAKAEREYERQKRLFEQDLISEQAFNDTLYQVEQLRISLADAERELSYTELRAPIAGTITARLVERGDQITPNQHCFDLVDFDSLVARVYVPEKNLPQLRPGLAARLFVPAYGGREYEARVDRVAPVVDPKSGTVKVTVAVGRQRGLKPGLYVDVDLVTEVRADALLVPKRALVYDKDRIFVFRVREDDTVERIGVEPRLADKEFIEPLAGLREGDRVVVAGQTGLKPGAKVEILDGKGAGPTGEEPAQAAAGSRAAEAS